MPIPRNKYSNFWYLVHSHLIKIFHTYLHKNCKVCGDPVQEPIAYKSDTFPLNLTMDQEPRALQVQVSHPHSDKNQIYHVPSSGRLFVSNALTVLPDPELIKWSNAGGEGVEGSNLSDALLFCLNYSIIHPKF